MDKTEKSGVCGTFYPSLYDTFGEMYKHVDMILKNKQNVEN